MSLLVANRAGLRSSPSTGSGARFCIRASRASLCERPSITNSIEGAQLFGATTPRARARLIVHRSGEAPRSRQRYFGRCERH